MADVFTRRRRSAIMANIKSCGNAATELRLIRILRKQKIAGWRRHKNIFGSPDFVFPAIKVALFVDGCFWHGCPIHGSIPRTNRPFWATKIARNVVRDKLVNKRLRENDWRVLRIWQHELCDSNRVSRRIKRVIGS